MLSISDLRKKYLGAPEATDEDMEIVRAVREYVDGEIMPRRRDLEGGWHRDEKLARDTFEKVHQGLVDIDVQRAMWPKDFGGLGVSGLVNNLMIEEISRGDAGLATHVGIIGWVMLPALVAGRMDLLYMFNRMQRDCLSVDQLKKWECVGRTQMLKSILTTLGSQKKTG